MRKNHPSSDIRTLADLKAREERLLQEVQLAKQSAFSSANASRKKFGDLLLNRVAPVAAVGVGLAVAYHFFGHKEEAPSKRPSAPRQKSSWIDLVVLLLPLLNTLLPAAKALYKDFTEQQEELGKEKAPKPRPVKTSK